MRHALKFPVTMEARVRSQTIHCGICGGKSDSGTGFCPSTLAFLCQFDSIKGPYFMYRLPLTLYT